MNDGPGVRRALEAMAHLGDPEPPWTALLQAMQAVIGGDSATLIVLEGGGELLNFQQHNVSEAAQREYAQHFCSLDILVPPTLGAATGSWFDTQALYSAAFLSRDPYYVDFMCRHDARRMLAYIVEEGPSRRCALTVQRSSTAGAVRRRLESVQVRRVTAALRQGLVRREALAARWLDGVASAFGAFGEAVCLSTPRGTVLHASAHAHEFLAAGPGLRMKQGRLLHPLASAHEALAAALAQAPLASQPLHLSLPGAAHMPDHLELVRADPRLSLGKEALVFIRLRRGQAPGTASIDSLRSAFGITPAEARVLAALMAGQSPKQHAQAQGLSIHTVRSQLSTLMGKMSCTRQAELVRLGLRAVAP